MENILSNYSHVDCFMAGFGFCLLLGAVYSFMNYIHELAWKLLRERKEAKYD